MKLELWLDTLKTSACPSLDEIKHYLGAIFPLLDELEQTEQDPQWHGEGNVWIHTQWVLDALYDLLDSKASHIRGEQRQALILGAAFHDIAKPMCTKHREIDGITRIVSPRHEAQGAAYIATRIAALPLSAQVIFQVIGLVGQHHMPKLLVVKDKGPEHYYRLAQNVEPELVYWLEIADMQGRLCPDKALQIEILDTFQLFCEEYALWDAGAQFKQWRQLSYQASMAQPAHADYLYPVMLREMAQARVFCPEESIARSFDARHSYAELVILVGPSGSGKSHWIAQHYASAVVISLDDIRESLFGHRAKQDNPGQVLATAYQQLRQALANKRKIVWDATSLRTDFRSKLVNMAENYQALVTIEVFLTPAKALFKQNKARKHAIPEAILARQLRQFQWPQVDEAHRYCLILGSPGKKQRYINLGFV